MKGLIDIIPPDNKPNTVAMQNIKWSRKEHLKEYFKTTAGIVSVNALEKAAGIPRGTLNYFLNDTRDLPEHHLTAIEQQLRKINYS